MARRPKPSSARHSRPPGSTPSVLRIIGGKLRGQQIQYSGDTRTRPMKDRVREAIFNLVGPAIKQRLVIDLFAGTGAIGLEALSRGADKAILLEQHFPTARLVETNAASLNLSDQVEVFGTDTFFWVEHRMHRHAGLVQDQPWVVFCSPPYSFYSSRWQEMKQLIQTVIRQAPENSLLVLEANQEFDLSNLPDRDQWDVRTYPPAVVGIHVVEKQDQPHDPSTLLDSSR